MKQNRIILALLCMVTLCTSLFFTACNDNTQNQWDTSQRGNSDANINNLGLAAAYNDRTFYIGTEKGYDLIYEADENGAPQKAVTGLTGYIQFLNVLNDTFYFLGVTYDKEGNRSESIFSADLNGKNKNCIYTMAKGTSTSYLAAVGQLLIYASADEKGKTKVCAVNPTEKTEAELFTEKEALRSLQIYNGRFYYITENKICSVNMDGTDKKTIYKSPDWIGNLLILDHSVYFTKSLEDDIGRHDALCRVNKKGENYKELFSKGKWICNVNGNDKTIYFADHTYDNEGNLKEAVFYSLDTKTAKIAEIGRTETDYTGLEICNNLLIYHLNDEHLTTQVLPIE